MTNSLLLFTFSPIQSFITEARRAADLYTGSQILVELARAARDEIVNQMGGNAECIIYPGDRVENVPNRIVAKVPVDRAADIAKESKKALLMRWRDIADSTLQETHQIEETDEEKKNPFYRHIPSTADKVWKNIWERQTDENYLWEVFWSVAPLKDDSEKSYREAYDTVEQLLITAKFNRSFVQAEESGFKDSLSGKRETLHSKDQDGKQFWTGISGKNSNIAPVQIRPNGRERLDSIGLIKRFSKTAREKRIDPFNQFPSTSSVASADFLEAIKKTSALSTYQITVETLFPRKEKYQVRKESKEWKYDGDFFYEETLTSQRMKNDYGLDDISADKLSVCLNALNNLNQTAKDAVKQAADKSTARAKPSPYYAIIALDGDNMGERIRACGSAEEHRKFSNNIAKFSWEVDGISKRYFGAVIYNGGDDILAMAPLSTAFKMTKELATEFKNKTGNTASAGIAITHHLSPLGAALRAAQSAEKTAKNVTDKDAVCIVLHRRSGEPVQMVSKWDHEEGLVSLLLEYFKDDGCLTSKFPYDVIADARAGSALPPEAQLALLKRLVGRHKTKKLPEPEIFTERLHCWSKLMDDYAPHLIENSVKIPQGMSELGKWLSLTRFIAQGGGE